MRTIDEILVEVAKEKPGPELIQLKDCLRRIEETSTAFDAVVNDFGEPILESSGVYDFVVEQFEKNTFEKA